MSPELLPALLAGVGGVVVGAVVMFVIFRRNVTREKGGSYFSQETQAIPDLGQDVDVRELRILRALFGEAKGRRMESYKDAYYKRHLEATIEKGWVKQVGRRYLMTPQGEQVCRAYLKQLLDDWKPTDEG